MHQHAERRPIRRGTRPRITVALLAAVLAVTAAPAGSVSAAPPRGADLAVTVSGPVKPITAHTTATYEVAVRNLGPDAAQNSVLVFTLSPGASYRSAAPSQGTCTGTGTSVECSIGSLARRKVGTFAFQVAVADPESVTATGSASSQTNDPDNTNNSASVTTTVTPQVLPVTGTLTATPETVLIGQPVELIANIVNNDFDAEVDIILIISHESERAAFLYDSARTSRGVCQPAPRLVEPEASTPYSGRFSHVRCRLGKMEHGATAQLSFTTRTTEPTCSRPMIAVIFHDQLPPQGAGPVLDQRGIVVDGLRPVSCAAVTRSG